MAFRKIHQKYWQDPFIIDIDPLKRYFYLYLLTSPANNQLGIFEFNEKLAQVHTGLSPKQMNEQLVFFEQEGKIVRSTFSNEILLVNFWKHNKSSSSKILIHVENLIYEIEDAELVRQVKGLPEELLELVNY